jgi:O-antigen/teichoic acid export membrane protein
VISHAAVSGQFNSVSILFGMGRHKIWSRTLLAEGLVTACGMWFVLPRFGLYGGALLAGSAMILNRSIMACILVSHELKINAAVYASRIYLGPLSISAGVTALLYAIKKLWLPGHSWGQIALASALMLIPYLLLVIQYCLAEHHRDFLKNRVLRLVGIKQAVS